MESGGHWRVGFAGFGHVNRALARMLIDRRSELEARHGLSFAVTMVSSATRGALADADGLDTAGLLERGWSSREATLETIRAAPIDVLFEGTPLDPRSGQPATSHVRAALERGVSVVSANKGPVAFAIRQLQEIAWRTGAGFRFESAVADCLPIFNLFEVAVPVGRVTSFQGILNSTSNLVLQAVVQGKTQDEAIADARRLGLTEADPAHDLDGWDQAVKAVILANVLFGRDLRPGDVERTPLAAVDPDWARAEEQARRRVRLAASGGLEGPVRVSPVSLAPGEFLATLHGASLGVVLETDLAGTLVVGIIEPGVEQTAYGMLTDLVAIHKGRRLIQAPFPPRT